MTADWPLATAAGPPAGNLFGQVWPWLAALLGLVAVGTLVLYLLRRCVVHAETRRGEGFTLQDLRDLHASGALSDEEFERAKASIIGQVRATDTPRTDADDDDEAGMKP
jgi:hypothetical protein